jgi:hypothetical protein
MKKKYFNKRHELHAIETINAAMASGKFITMNAYAKEQSQDGLPLMRVHIWGHKEELRLPLNAWYVIQLKDYQQDNGTRLIASDEQDEQIDDNFCETLMQMLFIEQLHRSGANIIWDDPKPKKMYQRALCSFPKRMILFRLNKQEVVNMQVNKEMKEVNNE